MGILGIWFRGIENNVTERGTHMEGIWSWFWGNLWSVWGIIGMVAIWNWPWHL